MSANAQDTSFKSFCNNCLCVTNHKILFSRNIEGTDVFDRDAKYQTIECLGCENITFRREIYDHTSGYQDEDGGWIESVDIQLYPYPFDRKLLQGAYFLPSKIQIIYEETINCLKLNSYILAGVGFRTIIEAVCMDKSVTGKNLESKINNLSKNRLITEKEADRLHAVRFMGNDSVHEMVVSSKEALYIVLDIVEQLLNNLYLIDKRAGSNLDTFIETQDQFEYILVKRLRNFEIDSSYSLKEYLGKDYRRLNGKLAIFEKKLMENIKNGKFDMLIIGEIMKDAMGNLETAQYFTKAKDKNTLRKSLLNYIS